MEYYRLLEHRSQLYQQRYPEPPAEEESSSSSGEPSLAQRAAEEIKILKSLGFGGTVPKDIQPYHLEGWTQQRLLAQGDWEQLTPLVQRDLLGWQETAAMAPLWRQFSSFRDIDPHLREKISEAVVEYLFNLKENRHLQSKERNV